MFDITTYFMNFMNLPSRFHDAWKTRKSHFLFMIISPRAALPDFPSCFTEKLC